MAANEQVKVGRVAFRREGAMWNAYFMKPSTANDAVFVGSILISIVMTNSAVKAAFMATMRAAVGHTINQVTGVDPSWGGPEAAPEHERSGHG